MRKDVVVDAVPIRLIHARGYRDIWLTSSVETDLPSTITWLTSRDGDRYGKIIIYPQQVRATTEGDASRVDNSRHDPFNELKSHASQKAANLDRLGIPPRPKAC
jgi:hypothetical protein